MRRYARKVGSVGIVREMIDIWIVIATDEVPHEEIIAAGFDEVSDALSDEEVKTRYRVTTIFYVRDDRVHRPLRHN